MPHSILPSSAAFAQAGPPTIELTGIVRDFYGSAEPAGHPDFQSTQSALPGKILGSGGWFTQGSLAPTLDPDYKPVYTGAGLRVTKLAPGGIYAHWRDATARPIAYRLWNAGLSDIPGDWDGLGNGRVESAASFNQWYRDVPGVNLSMALTITLVRQVDESYLFDSRVDPPYVALGTFAPIDDQLFGNSSVNPAHNFHFTVELHAQFDHDDSADQFFHFVADDDLWVFIDGVLVIDLGGTHGGLEQYVDLTRLGLVNGETYRLDLFYAERSTSSGVLQIRSPVPLQSLTTSVSISAPFD